MTFTRFSVEPIMPTFQVVIRSNIYIMYISKRQTFIVPASSRLTPVSSCGTGRKAVARIPAHRLSYVPPGRSESSCPVPAYSGNSPESRVSGLFQNHKLYFLD
ncbi:hypothetical protein T05_4620 [Trichinella murrelli]|uniref:Uncharacterized protein n=1 Tax=Trichinella murrelli TaxID=144512 RepID=A0A0V0SWB6_9BILA|nr:hypothetical protein T05_4620 [Trichinella murrelli]